MGQVGRGRNQDGKGREEASGPGTLLNSLVLAIIGAVIGESWLVTIVSHTFGAFEIIVQGHVVEIAKISCPIYGLNMFRASLFSRHILS